MRKFLVGVAVCYLLFCSCGKHDSGCQPVPVSNERQQLTIFCTNNNITYTEHSSGMFYQIISPGMGATPVATSTVSVIYTGKLLSGVGFDSSKTPTPLPLAQLIDGWKIGLPLIQKGGHIKLVIPSALAWSCAGNGNTIPSNTPVYFDITLTDVQ